MISTMKLQVNGLSFIYNLYFMQRSSECMLNERSDDFLDSVINKVELKTVSISEPLV